MISHGLIKQAETAWCLGFLQQDFSIILLAFIIQIKGLFWKLLVLLKICWKTPINSISVEQTAYFVMSCDIIDMNLSLLLYSCCLLTESLFVDFRSIVLVITQFNTYLHWLLNLSSPCVSHHVAQLSDLDFYAVLCLALEMTKLLNKNSKLTS